LLPSVYKLFFSVSFILSAFGLPLCLAMLFLAARRPYITHAVELLGILSEVNTAVTGIEDVLAAARVGHDHENSEAMQAELKAAYVNQKSLPGDQDHQGFGRLGSPHTPKTTPVASCIAHRQPMQPMPVFFILTLSMCPTHALSSPRGASWTRTSHRDTEIFDNRYSNPLLCCIFSLF
jgi:hypothetical protein